MVNGARLIVLQVSENLIQAKFISGSHKDKIIFIPKIELTPSDTDYPFSLSRTQFPVINAFALTINKSQGQSFSKVGIYLTHDVFTNFCQLKKLKKLTADLTFRYKTIRLV